MTDEPSMHEAPEETIDDLEAPAEAQRDVAGGDAVRQPLRKNMGRDAERWLEARSE